MVTAVSKYYKEVVKITEEFLGPAAERFVNRQIEFHLDKQPASITADDIPKLQESLRVALGLLVDDKRIVEKAMRKFDNITKD